MTAPPIGVLVVDDEDLIRSGLSAILEAEPDLTVLGEAADGAEVPALVDRLRPDVVVMDVRMPGVDGIRATQLLLDRFDVPPAVLIVTTFDNDDYVYQALHAGARGFILKRARPAELARAVRVVASGDSLLFPQAVRQLVAAHGPRPATAPAVLALTEREADVLRRMAGGASNAEIAAELFLGVETVKTHVGNVLAKLGVRDRTQAVIRAYESGFVGAGG